MTCSIAISRTFIGVVTFALASAIAQAQQLEPRAYSPAPVGMNYFGVATGYQHGDVLTDPSLPLENVTAEAYTAAPFYGRTFGLAGHLASVTALLPAARLSATGDVKEVNRTASRSGMLDPQFRFAVNLIGGPALSPREFAQFKQQTTLGVSLSVNAPFGQYDPSRLVNLGTNRWAFKPELGLSYPIDKLTIELYAGLTFFQTTDDFYGGQVRKQDELTSIQTHVVYNFRRNLWLAADFTYYSGGSTTVNDQAKNDRQDNTRGGLTLALPLATGQSVKLAWARGVSTRIGSSFETFGIAWQMAWY